MALFTNADSTLDVLFFTIAAAVHIKFLADIKDKATQLFNGLSFQSQVISEPQNEVIEPVNIDSVVVVSDPVIATDTIASDDPQPITDVIQQTIDQVGEQAKTQAVSDLTAKFTAVVQEAIQPVVTEPM